MGSSLKYADMTDKAYGLAGMAIALMAWNAEEWLEGIILDADPEEALVMTPYYYTCCAPQIRTKSVWDVSFKRFQLEAAMTIANVTCRTMVYLCQEPCKLDDRIKCLLVDEGAILCGLEEDEIESICNKNFAYSLKLFGNTRVHIAVQKLANELIAKRSMNANEVFNSIGSLLQF